MVYCKHCLLKLMLFLQFIAYLLEWGKLYYCQRSTKKWYKEQMNVNLLRNTEMTQTYMKHWSQSIIKVKPKVRFMVGLRNKNLHTIEIGASIWYTFWHIIVYILGDSWQRDYFQPVCIWHNRLMAQIEHSFLVISLITVSINTDVLKIGGEIITYRKPQLEKI